MIGVFVMPVFVMLLMVSLFGTIESKLSSQPDVKIAIVGNADNQVVQELSNSKGSPVIEKSTSLSKSLADLEKGEVRLVLEFPDDFANQVTARQAA